MVDTTLENFGSRIRLLGLQPTLECLGDYAQNPLFVGAKIERYAISRFRNQCAKSHVLPLNNLTVGITNYQAPLFLEGRSFISAHRQIQSKQKASVRGQ